MVIIKSAISKLACLLFAKRNVTLIFVISTVFPFNLLYQRVISIWDCSSKYKNNRISDASPILLKMDARCHIN